EGLGRAGGAAVRALLQARRPGSAGDMRIALALPARDYAETGAVALGALLGGYTFRRYRSEPAPGASLTLLAHASDAAQAVHQAAVLADPGGPVPDLVNTPPSDLVTATFPARSQAGPEQVGGDSGLWVTARDGRALAGAGSGGILGGGQGSVPPPRLVRLEYAPDAASRSLVLAGKGITFDSGGLSLKPAKSM